MPSQHIHCRGILDFTQVYLEWKLAIEVLLHNPSNIFLAAKISIRQAMEPDTAFW